MRILKHGQASDRAIELARKLECDMCKSHTTPKPALPAQTHRISEFNQQIGIDVKLLPGWRPNQRIKAFNIVDTASGFQRVLPFFESRDSHSPHRCRGPLPTRQD